MLVGWMLVLACRSGGPPFAELDVRLVTDAGVPPPGGSAPLIQEATPEDLGPGGVVLIPGGPERRHGRIGFGDTVRIRVHEGVVALQVIGDFQPTGTCAGRGTDSAACVDGPWEGYAGVWASDAEPPPSRSFDEHVRGGEVGSVDILLVEGCVCED